MRHEVIMRLLFTSGFVVLTACSAFLLDSNVPSVYITAKEFRDLMDLILEEKHSRRQLEHNVGTMHQAADNNDAALKQLSNDYHSLSGGFRQLFDSHADMKRGLQNLRSHNQTIQTTLHNNSAGITELKQKLGYSSAFTAYSPSLTHPSGNVKFGSVLANIGADYSASTGAFICQYPGIYMFTTHLYNSPLSSYDYVDCYIRLNGSTKIKVYSYPRYINRYYESSNSIVLHLNHGDLITVGRCTSRTGLFNYSSFSGYLVQAD